MGEVAHMMAMGLLCQECGVVIGDAVGYPRSCAACTMNRAGADQSRKISRKYKARHRGRRKR